MSDLLIAAPLWLEALAIRSGVKLATVRRTGVGRRRARTAASELLEQPGAVLVVMGFAGALDDRSVPGDAIVAEEVRGPDGVAIACSGAEAVAGALAARGLTVRRGPIASVARVAVGGTVRARLRETGAIAVDMESAWLASAAGARPFAVVRVVLDTPARELTRPVLTLSGAGRASLSLRRAAGALDRLVRERGVHTVFGGGSLPEP